MLVSLLAAASRPRLAARRHEREHFRLTRRVAEDEQIDLLHARLRSAALHDDSLWGVPLTSEPAPDSRHLLRRFLEARDWDVEQAADMIEGTLAWRSEFGAAATQPDAFPGSECGRDDSGSAQIVLRLEHVREDAFADVARYARWCVSLHEAAIRQLDLAGQHLDAAARPAYRIVVDCRGMSAYHFGGAARKCARHLAGLMQNHYPDFVGETLIVNAPATMARLWGVVRRVLPAKFAAAVRVTTDDAAAPAMADFEVAQPPYVKYAM